MIQKHPKYNLRLSSLHSFDSMKALLKTVGRDKEHVQEDVHDEIKGRPT